MLLQFFEKNCGSRNNNSCRRLVLSRVVSRFLCIGSIYTVIIIVGKKLLCIFHKITIAGLIYTNKYFFGSAVGNKASQLFLLFFACLVGMAHPYLRKPFFIINNTVPEIAAQSIISAAVQTDAGYRFSFDASDSSKEYLVDMTRQDDCPMFYQLMCILHGDNFKANMDICNDLADIIVYIDFSGIFDRNPIGKIAEQQRIAEYMFRPEGIYLDFGKGANRYLAFERSASMSRQSRLSFIRADFFEPIRERMMLGMNIGLCQLSKFYAYNGLLFTGGRRIDDFQLDDKSIVLVDNPKSIVSGVPTITVEDDGTDSPMRTYTRVEKTADIEVTEFDGEGLISAELSKKLNPYTCDAIIRHHSFQIRMPYIKGVVHEVNFKSLYTELGVTHITDIFGVSHAVSEVQMILTKSMFKGFGWMKENGLSFAEYLGRCRKYRHALYVSGMDSLKEQQFTEFNYQFLNTAAITDEEFRPSDLPLGWTHTPEWDRREWVTKATEMAYWNYIGDNGERRRYFLQDLNDETIERTDRKYQRAKLIEKNGLYAEEPIFAKELQSKAEHILSGYGVGRLTVSGDNRYLSDDLMRLLAYLIKDTEAYSVLEAECLSGSTFYAPKPCYTENDTYTLLRNPHISRNEEATVIPLSEVGEIREKYLSHLRYVVMVDSRSLIPDHLGGADYDGDMVKTISDPLINRCVARNADDKPLLKIPTAEPLIQDANDWESRFKSVRSTFSSRVGQISNAALNRSVIAYDENSNGEERENCRKETETLAILTGLEIDSAKSGIKPDLSEYLGTRKVKRSAFLKYKYIVDKSDNPKWYEPTQNQKLNKFYQSVNWDDVSSNLEKLPYYARRLELDTQKCTPIPVSDESLFLFANEPGWKDKLNKEMLSRMIALIDDYEEAQRRCRYLHIDTEYMTRRTDIGRILYARGQEQEYSVDALYHAFDRVSPQNMRKARHRLSESEWIYTPKEEREKVLLSVLPISTDFSFNDLFCDFRNGGFRILGDIICDYDDMYSRRDIRKHLTAKKGDSKDLRLMLKDIEKEPDYKETLNKRCLACLQPPDAKQQTDFAEAAKCAIALGKRQFALEILPGALLELTLDRSHIFSEPKPQKKRWFRR
ncbi:MAG: RNA dependent RNA polymerase [Candidatus Howiella sp.]